MKRQSSRFSGVSARERFSLPPPPRDRNTHSALLLRDARLSYDPRRTMAPSGVIGREVELAALASFLDDVPRGSTALVLEGAAGMGKTTLWRGGGEAACERAVGVL